MYDATAREAHELRLEVGQCLSQVFAQTMTLIGVLRHQRYHIDIYHTLVQHQNLQGGIRTISIWCKSSLILLPVLGIGSDGGISQQLGILTPALRLYQCDANLLGVALIAQKYGEIVLGTSLHADTVETVVLDTIALPAFVVIILLDTLCG